MKTNNIKKIYIDKISHNFQEKIIIPDELISKKYWDKINQADVQYNTKDNVLVRLQFISTTNKGVEKFEHLFMTLYGYRMEIIVGMYHKRYSIYNDKIWHLIKMIKI